MCAINLGQAPICEFEAVRRRYVISLLAVVSHDSTFHDIARNSENDKHTVKNAHSHSVFFSSVAILLFAAG